MYKGFIYKITNTINGKSYIGQTKNFKTRIKQHFSYSKNKMNPLYCAIRKYDKNNFKISIVEEIECGYEKDLHFKLNTAEKYYIKKYNTFINHEKSKGYNLTLGGEGTYGHRLNEEAKKKISAARKGKVPWNKGIPMSREQKIKLSESKRGKETWNKNIPLSLKQKEKISLTMKRLFQEKVLSGRKKENNPMYGKIPWNKGKKGLQEAWNKGKQMNSSYKQNIKNSWNNRDREMSGEQKKKISDTLKKFYIERKGDYVFNN